jgi:hypothetical protein
MIADGGMCMIVGGEQDFSICCYPTIIVYGVIFRDVLCLTVSLLFLYSH